MPFSILRNDIAGMKADAIVNSANQKPRIGPGSDAAIYAQAGPMLLAARKLIGTIHPGHARITPGFRLEARYVIHTVAPQWQGGCHNEEQLLRQCYRRSLAIARRKRLRSVAFPVLSAGHNGFPAELALKIAVEEIRSFLENHDLQIYLVVFSREVFLLSSQLVEEVRSLIDETHVFRQQEKEAILAFSPDFDRRNAPIEAACSAVLPTAAPKEARPLPKAAMPLPRQTRGFKKHAASAAGLPFDRNELKRMVRQADAGFSETLLRLIDATEKKDSEIYKRANVDRKLFSKIRNNPAYKPSKPTAVAFAIALELDLEQTRDLIGRAGYALSRSSEFDIIIEYFITHGCYDIMEINMVLFEFDQSLLGS